MSLKASVIYNNKRYDGTDKDTHVDVMKKHGIPPEAKHERGFVTPENRFLNRAMAKSWLREHHPDVYKRWVELNGEGENGTLHSQDLHRAMQKKMDMSKMRCLVLDLGLATENAVRIGRDVAECWYWTNHADPFPEPFQMKIGEGLEGIERVISYHQYLDRADFIFVPDILFAEEVEWMKSHDYPVCGGGFSEKLELDRWYGRGIQAYGREWKRGEPEPEERNLPAQHTERVAGITALREFTKKHKNFWVKIDAIRGLEESWSYTDEKDCEQTIDNIAAKLGPYKEDIVFICEEKLDGVEPGLDMIAFDDEILYPTMIGYEGKSVGIIERVYQTPDDLPPSARWVHEGFKKEFEKNKTRMFVSFEYMIGKNKKPYVIDPSIRHGYPGVAAIQCELIENYPEVIYGLATGQKINPITKWKYAAAAAMESGFADKNWTNIAFPKEIRQWIKLRMAVKHKNEYYAVPGLDSLGVALGFGNTIDAALKQCEDRAMQVQAKRISRGIDELKKIKKSIDEGISYGVPF